MQSSRGNRKGRNFTLRWSDAEWEELGRLRQGSQGPAALGTWILWAVRRALPAPATRAALPGQVDMQALPLRSRPEALPGPALGRHCRAGGAGALPELAERIVLDLCGGSGAWSRPYRDAGYSVEIVTLPDHDVRTYVPPANVHGVLAAPPCEQFSTMRHGKGDWALGLETVCACLRIIALARPAWWALENPGSGLLRRWLGCPRDVWQPFEFGDPWTKLTAVWGDFVLPKRTYCRPRSGMPGATAAERAITPPGFAEAFFAANP
jgi:hypothetical protein